MWRKLLVLDVKRENQVILIMKQSFSHDKVYLEAVFPVIPVDGFIVGSSTLLGQEEKITFVGNRDKSLTSF